jgi:hypothetical protein
MRAGAARNAARGSLPCMPPPAAIFLFGEIVKKSTA